MSRAILIVDHGSRRPEAHAHLERVAAAVRERSGARSVYIAHMELCEPSIHDAIARCAADGVTELWVHPFFLIPGQHAREDVPSLVEAAAALHPGLHTRIGPALGAAPELADLIVRTVDGSQTP